MASISVSLSEEIFREHLSHHTTAHALEKRRRGLKLRSRVARQTAHCLHSVSVNWECENDTILSCGANFQKKNKDILDSFPICSELFTLHNVDTEMTLAGVQV